MSSSKRMLFASAAIAQILIAAPAFASANEEAAADEKAHGDNEIVVTAFKRDQNVQDVPAAVAAVSGDTLNDRGITDPSDLQYITPSLQVGKSQGNTGFTIRGVGYNTVGSPAVAVHVDGVFQARPSMGDLAQIDVERVEVLRGPQGTLYGRNANGGVINFLSKRPTDVFEGSVKARYASFDEILLEGVLNVPLGENAGARLVLSHNEQGDGFVKNIAGGPDLGKEGHDAVRLAVDVDLATNVKLEMTGFYVERDGAVYNSIAQTRPFTNGARGAPFGNLFAFRGDLYAALGAVHTTLPNRTTANDPSGSDRKAVGISAVLNWDLGAVQFKSITGYQDSHEDHYSDFDGTNVTIYKGRNIKDSETFTQEFNVSGGVGPVDFVVGLYYFDEAYKQDLSIDEPNGNGTFQPGAFLSFKTPYYDSKTVAVFTDVTWNITDDFRVVGGLRYSKDKQNSFQDYTINATIQNSPTTTITLGRQCFNALPELKSTSTTPRFGLQFDVSDGSTAYANYAEGFKVGGYNTEGTCTDIYLPEEIKSYEAGLKNTFLDGDLTLNITGFFYSYRNLQLQQIIGTGVSVVNAPRAEIKGLELESNFRASDSLSLFGSVSFLDAKYTEFLNADGASGSAVPVDVSGNRLNNAPKIALNGGFEFSPALNIAGGGLTFRGDVSHRGTTYLREFNSPEETQGAYTVVNASLTWTSASNNFSLRGFATNLFDETYLTQSQWAAPTNARTVSYGQPRQYGIEALFKF